MSKRTYRRIVELNREISEDTRTLAEHRMLAGIHVDEPKAFRVCMHLASIAYNHRELARRELSTLSSEAR